MELLDTIDCENVNVIAIVGDAFAKPILAALDEHPGRWKLSTLLAMISSGVMFSEETKRALLRHHPTMMLVDAFSSSEALGMGASVSSASSTEHTAHFTLGPDVRVLDPDTGKSVIPGSGEVGVLALGGRNPVGYYKDEQKSAKTFKEIDGVRYSIPGDFATVDSRRFHPTARTRIGRDQHGWGEGLSRGGRRGAEDAPAVRDAVAVAIPDERFGEVVAAVVEMRPGLAHQADAENRSSSTT